ncbi:hypothetical protein PsorP6_016451 [Peronosclerospora sorghi]|uniref:Uncharacterized protein n=1 Tax=Peronosclerospora sorghi TaxID=230839 RepID=A0ACC0VP65_9STRA|nr:hypothetical protein PsorP6_016451 [Peronosclerospora sorghi]
MVCWLRTKRMKSLARRSAACCSLTRTARRPIQDDAVGRSVDETLWMLQAFQVRGVSRARSVCVCPANWKPGDETIRTNHREKLAFSTTHGHGNAAQGHEQDQTRDHTLGKVAFENVVLVMLSFSGHALGGRRDATTACHAQVRGGLLDYLADHGGEEGGGKWFVWFCLDT